MTGLLLGLIGAAGAQIYEPPHLTLYGTPGLVEMPNARLQRDGTLSLTASTKQPDDRITVAFNITPWLEGTARYSVINGFFGAEGPLYDRSLGFKLRLVEEGSWMPQIAVGALDIGGTLVFGGEYIVASKKFGFVDTTLGLGFGRLGSTGDLTNPLVYASDKFRDREVEGAISETGQIGAQKFFRGEDVALFGGVSLETPIRGLNLIAEYSGDAYVPERERGVYQPDSQFNFGIGYAPWDPLELSAGWIGGNELYVSLSLRNNLKNPPKIIKLDPTPPPTKVRSEAEVNQAIASRLNLIDDEHLRSQKTQTGQSPAARFEAAADSMTPTVDDDLRRAHFEAFADGLDPQLNAIGYRLGRRTLDGANAEFEVVALSVRAPLMCNELWRALRSGSLPGIEQLAFTERSEAVAPSRCVMTLKTQRGHTAKNKFNTDPTPSSGGESVGAGAEQPMVGFKSGPLEMWWSNADKVAELEAKIAKALKDQKLDPERVKLTRDEVSVHVYNGTYPSQGKAIGRTARVLSHLAPPTVELFRIVVTTGDVNGMEVVIPRTALERIAATGGTSEELFVSSDLRSAQPGLPAGGWRDRADYPSISPIFAPDFKPSLFDPDDPFRFQFAWNVGAAVKLVRGLSAEGVYSVNIYNNFNEISRQSDSQLPRVRSDFARYLQEGDSGLARLQLTHLHQFGKEVYTRLAVGYLEDMYAGISGEVLYVPGLKRWALGAELSQVWQRDFDRGFGVQDYNVVTGHVSLYYDSPFYDLDLAVHAGRYLAKDYGATFEVMRRFESGAAVGAFATFTDVGFEKFGEGSFDKGIRIVIPLDMISLFSTQRKMGVTLRPLTRDGGARLNVSPRLYEMTEPVRYDSVERSWHDFLHKR